MSPLLLLLLLLLLYIFNFNFSRSAEFAVYCVQTRMNRFCCFFFSNISLTLNLEYLHLLSECAYVYVCLGGRSTVAPTASRTDSSSVGNGIAALEWYHFTHSRIFNIEWLLAGYFFTKPLIFFLSLSLSLSSLFAFSVALIFFVSFFHVYLIEIKKTRC